MKKIAYQGIPGSYSYITAQNYFGQDNQFIGTDQFKDIFELIKNNQANYGVVPVENSLAGSVYENYDLLSQYDLQVTGEYYLKVEHCLLGLKSNQKISLQNIKNVYSHPKALEQCLKLFEENPWLTKNIFSDTASAAKYIANQNDASKAAIASLDTARLYNLQIIKKNIEDNPNNYTRFLIIANKPNQKATINKCSIIFKLPHIPGSLCKTLKYFADKNLNLINIESRPIHGLPFEYIFHVDLEFKHEDTATVKELLNTLKHKVIELKILGLYESNHGDIR